MTRQIIIQTRFGALHCWPDAPEEVFFLRQLHRHEFHVRLEIQVNHEDRELEFIMVKRALEREIQNWGYQLGSTSCEQMAERLIKWVQSTYGKTRFVSCQVMEDGENGAQVSV